MSAPVVKLPIGTPQSLPEWLKAAAQAANDNLPQTARQMAEERWGVHATREAAQDAAKSGVAAAGIEAGMIAVAVPAFLGTMGLAAYAYLADRNYYQNRHFIPCGGEASGERQRLSSPQATLHFSKVMPSMMAQADGDDLDPEMRKRLFAYAGKTLTTNAPADARDCPGIVVEMVESQTHLAKLRDELRQATIKKNPQRRAELLREIEAMDIRLQLLAVEGMPVCGRDLLTPAERFAHDHPVRDALNRFGRRLGHGLAVGAIVLLKGSATAAVAGGLGYGAVHAWNAIPDEEVKSPVQDSTQQTLLTQLKAAPTEARRLAILKTLALYCDTKHFSYQAMDEALWQYLQEAYVAPGTSDENIITIRGIIREVVNQSLYVTARVTWFLGDSNVERVDRIKSSGQYPNFQVGSQLQTWLAQSIKAADTPHQQLKLLEMVHSLRRAVFNSDINHSNRLISMNPDLRDALVTLQINPKTASDVLQRIQTEIRGDLRQPDPDQLLQSGDGSPI